MSALIPSWAEARLRHTLTRSPVLAVRHRLWAVVTQKVKIELVVRVGKLADLLHSQELVVLERCLGVFHPQPEELLAYRIS